MFLSFRRNFALRFWNQTYIKRNKQKDYKTKSIAFSKHWIFFFGFQAAEFFYLYPGFTKVNSSRKFLSDKRIGVVGAFEHPL